MKKKAVIIFKGSRYWIACDTKIMTDFIEYCFQNQRNWKEMKLIFNQIIEGHHSKKFSREQVCKNCYAMKPFKNNDNDRILCLGKSQSAGNPKIIIICEFFKKKTNNIDKKLKERFQSIYKNEYEIV